MRCSLITILHWWVVVNTTKKVPVDFLSDDVCVEDLVEPVVEIQGAGGPGPGHQRGDCLEIQRHHPDNSANEDTKLT